MRERRVTGAEVVDREPNAERLDRAENLHCPLGVVHDHAFRDLELEQRRIHSRFTQNGLYLAYKPFVVELAHRQVHAHLHGRQAGLLPRDVLLARGAQHPSTDRHDQARLFGERDELHRRHAAELRALPTQQRLDAGDRAGLEIHLGLISERELLELERPAQIRLEREPLDRVRFHAAAIELIVVLALFLREVHRHVGVLHHRLLVLPLLGMHTDADARRDAALLPEDHDRLHDGRQNVARHHADLADVRNLLHEHDELVAAEPRDDVARAQALPQSCRHLAQQYVARFVAQRVVDHLEAVEIDEQHRELAVVATARLDREIEELSEHRAIGQTREAVVGREVLDSFLGTLARGDVLDDRDVVQRGAGAIALHRDREADPDRRPVLAHVALLELERRDRPRAQPGVQIVGGRHVARMRDLLHREREQLAFAVAEHLAELRIRVEEVAVVVDVRNADRGELHRRGESLLALAQPLHRERALIEVSDLSAREAQNPQELRLGRRDLRRIEVEHADDLAAGLDRDHEAGVPRLRRARRRRVARACDATSPIQTGPELSQLGSAASSARTDCGALVRGAPARRDDAKFPSRRPSRSCRPSIARTRTSPRSPRRCRS